MLAGMSAELVHGRSAVLEQLVTWSGTNTMSTTDPYLLGSLLTRDRPAATTWSVLTTVSCLDTIESVDYLSWSLTEAIEAGTFTVSRIDRQIPSVALGEDELIAFIEFETTLAGLRIGAHGELGLLLKHCLGEVRASSPQWTPTQPTLTTVLDTYEAHFGEDAAMHLEECLGAIWDQQLAGETYDALEFATLVAAHNGSWLGNLGAWGRASGVATEADFSRIKQRFEEAGLIEVESIADGVGRPQQRLTLRLDALDVTAREALDTLV